MITSNKVPVIVILLILASLPLPRNASAKDNSTEITLSENDNRETSRKERKLETFESAGDKLDLLGVLPRQIIHNASTTLAGNYVVIGPQEEKTRQKRSSRRQRKFKILPFLCG